MTSEIIMIKKPRLDKKQLFGEKNILTIEALCLPSVKALTMGWRDEFYYVNIIYFSLLNKLSH